MKKQTIKNKDSLTLEIGRIFFKIGLSGVKSFVFALSQIVWMFAGVLLMGASLLYLIKNAIKKVAFKNIKQINEWVEENPACKDPRTKKYDQYNKIVMNAMSGVTEKEQHDNIEKIVRNVTKAVAIDKTLVINN